jgi:outer membrane protein TolC
MHFKLISHGLVGVAWFLTFSVCAQTLPPFRSQDTAYQAITLAAFLNELNDKNASIKVRKLNTNSASSIAQQAGAPHLSPILTYARGSIYTQSPYTGYTNPASNTLGATVTVEGWGKRSAREAQAQAEANRQLAEMVTESRSIETQAIFNYIDALRVKLLWQSYQSAIDGLSLVNSQEANTYKFEFLSSQKTLASDLKYYSYGMIALLNSPEKNLPLPVGSLSIPPQSFQVNQLIERAQDNRSDLSLGKASIESAAANLELVKASKNVDFLPGLYYTETPPYSSSGTNYGTQKSFSFLLSIPLGNGMLNNSDVIAASNTVAEHEVNLLATKTRVVTEINQTYLQYQSAKERLENAIRSYNQAKGMRKSGIQGLIKYRDAEYELIDARTIHAKTLILLERLSGNFDIPNLQ